MSVTIHALTIETWSGIPYPSLSTWSVVDKREPRQVTAVVTAACRDCLACAGNAAGEELRGQGAQEQRRPSQCSGARGVQPRLCEMRMRTHTLLSCVWARMVTGMLFFEARGMRGDRLCRTSHEGVTALCDAHGCCRTMCNTGRKLLKRSRQPRQDIRRVPAAAAAAHVPA